jgi:hypothetical protein
MARGSHCPRCRRALDGDAVCPTCGKHISSDARGMRARDDDYDDDDRRDADYDDAPDISRRRKSKQRPGKVQAVSIMTLIGGIYAIVHFLGVGGGSTGLCCLWPGLYYALVVGIFAIVKGSQLLGENARAQTPPKGVAIMMIINIINGDMINCVLGIIILVFCSDPEVENFFKG